MSLFMLYFAPGTCARVAMIALEEARVRYERKLISFVRGDHRADWFRALNPKARVPVLVVDGEPLSESVAILAWLDRRFPDAGLLPRREGPLDAAHYLADLVWCAAGLHPLVTRMRLPQFFSDLPDARENVRALAHAAMSAELARIDARLAKAPWWYGERWSVMDAYLNWVWFRVTGSGIDPALFPHVADHDRRLAERPSVRRTLAIHAAADQELEDQGLALDPATFVQPAGASRPDSR